MFSISNYCLFSLKGSRPVIPLWDPGSSFVLTSGPRFQARCSGQPLVACSGCWYHTFSTHHSSFMRKINMKTSLAASVLFHPAGHSLGQGTEPASRSQDQTGVCRCCASQCWLKGFYCLLLRESWAQLFPRLVGLGDGSMWEGLRQGSPGPTPATIPPQLLVPLPFPKWLL